MNELYKILKRRTLFLDGAMGHNLLDKGLAPGESPSILNIKNPQAVYDLHRAYVNAGSDVILTNTFTANPFNMPSNKLREVIFEGVRLARRAAKNKAIVFGDIGPLGELIKPYGQLDFNEVLQIYKIIAKYFDQAGIKYFFIETFTSIIEAKAAFLAARSYSNDIFVNLSLQESGRTIMGDIAESIAVTFEALGAKGIGINCTLPEVAIEAVSKMARITNLPLVIKPNAGRVEIVGNKVHHTISDHQMSKYFKEFVKAGASIIGGCCGTSPDYIKMITKNKQRTIAGSIRKKFILASPCKTLEIKNDATVVVGERLNPSGCKKVKQRLKIRDYTVYGEEARAQEDAGADLLDVNAFLIDLDEKETLLNGIFEALKNSVLPLFVDTQNFDAAERILSCYPGIGAYNSIPAKRKDLIKWLPMVKKYGFKAIVSLVGKKIPRSVNERMHNVELTLGVAKKIGFPKADLIFDPLVFSAATEPEQINYTLETVRSLHKLGLKTILGISNVSFGLPDRSFLNAGLTIAAINNGAAFLILNPLDDIVMKAFNASNRLLKGRMPTTYFSHKERKLPIIKKMSLTEAIIYGDSNLSAALTRKLLDAGVSAQAVIDNHISKALKAVGDYYENGKFFIPDLLKAAEASKSVLAIVRKRLPKRQRKGKIVLATVKGDIHDIGKNIAAMMFESAGYEVIDLGKDVATEKIIKAIETYRPDALGLSALLTTTTPQMAHVVQALHKKKLNVKVIIGGPNVSKEYAQRIGAFGAAKNVIEGLRLLKQIK